MSYRKNRNTILSVACSLFALGLCASGVKAFTFHAFCCGDAVFYDGGSSLLEQRNACTISAAGDGWVGDSFQFALSFWNAAENMTFAAGSVRSAKDCRIGLSDGVSETALVNPSAVAPAVGLTTYAHVNFCFCDDGGDYGETDTRIANNLDFSNTDGQHALARRVSVVGSGRPVFLHEFGHQLGLDHAELFSVMTNNTSALVPLGGDVRSHPTVFPDDIRGVRSHYGTRNVTNVFTSAQAPSTTVNSTDNNPSPFLVCQSGLLNVNTTIINSGAAAATFRTTVYLATSPDLPASRASFIVGRFNSTLQPASASAAVFSAFGPFTSAPITGSGALIGGLFMLHEADDNHRITENDEQDNITTDGMVAIFDC